MFNYITHSYDFSYTISLKNLPSPGQISPGLNIDLLMTLAQFECLAIEKRLKVVVDGICVASREESGCRVLLFQLDSFYVEVFYNEHYDFISHLHAFDGLDCLTPYLEKISLENVFR